jgi:PAS domain S-box-containing protein
MTRALNEAREKERQMLQKIMMAEARVRSMIENMPVGLITLTESSAIDGINPRVEELFHLDADHLIGKQLDPLFENPAGADKSILQTLLSTGEGSKSEYVALKDDGTTFYSELSINTFETFEGKRYLLSIQDVTERHELERLKQEFYAMIAHDLRTPLMSAQLSIGVINDGILGEVNPKIRTSLERAETGIKRLTTLINDFLDFEKLQSGKFDLNCKQMLLSSLIDRSVSEVKGLLDKYGLQIETPDMDAITYADEDRLIQVMINFLSNAIKFSPEKSTIRIDAEMIDKEILVSVIDQGPGIPPQLQEKLFKSFSMLKNQSSNVKIKGTGLGLAICKMIVEQHGGSIGVNSKEGEGSTFWFKIPIKES